MLNRSQFDHRLPDDVAAALRRAHAQGEGAVRLDPRDRAFGRQIDLLRREADVVVHVEGVTAENLDAHAAAICALAADNDVPVRFDLDGRLMQVSLATGGAPPP